MGWFITFEMIRRVVVNLLRIILVTLGWVFSGFPCFGHGVHFSEATQVEESETNWARHDGWGCVYFRQANGSSQMKSWTLRIILMCVCTGVHGMADIDFNRDIRPILSNKCYHCHGPDANNQKSEFQIHTFEKATADLGGIQGIVPGDLKMSEVYRRIHLSADADDVMPPVDSNRQLSAREKELITAWIQQGAAYDLHWAFKPISKPQLPDLEPELSNRARNAIDHFVFAKLSENRLLPSPEASLETRMRRASLTLAGLSPIGYSKNEALNEGDDSMLYHQFVEKLLLSNDYAERQTLRWLNAARYADTDGYQNDAERTNWPWRDWVIKAFQENMPFDQFTIEQIAGDMLPEARTHQVLASAFNRNHRQNSEGGALAAEFFVENVIDRVETTSTVWLGLTMGCARCHDHKYDPVSQKDFFKFYAYFNNIGERGIGRGVQANPVLSTYSPLVEPPPELLADLNKAKKFQVEVAESLDARRDAWINKSAESLNQTSGNWKLQKSFSDIEVEKSEGKLVADTHGTLIFHGKNTSHANYRIQFRPGNMRVATLRIDALPDPAFGKPRQLARSVNGNFVVTDIKVSAVNTKAGTLRPLEISSATSTFEQQGYPIAQAIDANPTSGWAVFGGNKGPEPVTAYLALSSPVELSQDEFIELRIAHESTFVNHNIGKLQIHSSSQNESHHTLPPNIVSALELKESERSESDLKSLSEYYRKIDLPTKHVSEAVAAAQKALEEAGVKPVNVMVMRERTGTPLPAYLLDRGQYDAPDKSAMLSRGLPDALNAWGSGSGGQKQPGNRLELARWIVSPDNPLTARVIVNRFWQDHFGVGLVSTPEDFGTQGELPSHPELLDWLAAEFMESGWDVMGLHRLILTSATYQQSSVVDETLINRDPSNRLLARGPRYRLDGFVIRDLALRAAGLLDYRIGGPPVKPYQPTGLWNSVAGSSNIRYRTSAGGDLYRKSLYTYWKRAVNPPRQLIFDAGGREACDVSVRRTNTPLQALVLMNDKTFIEAAVHLAGRVLEDPLSRDDRLARLFKRVTALSINSNQLGVLQNSLTYFIDHFGRNPEEAKQFVSSGYKLANSSITESEVAAWAAVAHLILNLDTSISVQ